MALRAMLLRAQKKYGESIELFDKAIKEFESIKANAWNAYYFARLVLCEYARVYIERDQRGDREKALNLLNQALEMFQRMGAKKDIEKVEARIALIETSREVSKPKPVETVSTGSAGLDRLPCGGISPNHAVVLTSPSCNERDLLIKSFLDTGAKKAEATFYVTIDPSLAKLLTGESSSFFLFVCNPQAEALVKDAPNVFKLKGVENLTDINIALSSVIRKLDPSCRAARRICLDVVSDVLLQHNAVQTRRWLTSLIAELKTARFTVLAVFDPEMHSSQDARAILDLFEGEINIREKETERGLERYLRIRKMSGLKYLEDEVLLKKEQA
jgi:KaiC/GvpD/RAD55 family RecA-like ATPase